MNGRPHGLEHLREAFRWNDWLPAEAYVQGKLAVQFDLWVRSRDHNVGLQHQIAVFQRAVGVELTRLDGRLDISNGGDVEDWRVRFLDRSHNGQQEPVFVFVREASERVEGVSAWAVVSTVGLGVFVDEPDGTWVHAANHPLPAFALRMSAFRGGSLVENREGRPAMGGLSVSPDQGPSHVIERSAEVLNEVPDDQPPPRREGALDEYAQEVARGFHVYLGAESEGLGFRLNEGTNLRPERIKMTLRAVDLPQASVEGMPG